MRISHLKISNILGIDELEFDAGQFVEVGGPNGAGKTSVLEAIKAALGQGHDATLLRKGADSGEVVLVLDDGTAIRRRVKAGASDTQVRGSDGKLVTKPGTTIAGLIDALSVNPIDFLRASKKDRARVLLESMPIAVDVQQLAELAGVQPQSVASANLSGLDLIEAVRRAVYDERTGTNRAIRDRESTIARMQATVPDAPGGVEGDEDSLLTQIQRADEARDGEMQRIAGKLQRIEHEAAQKIAAIRAEAQRQIDEVNATLEQTRAAASAQRTLTQQRHADAVTPLREARAAIAANRDAAAKRRVALETIATMQAELATLQTAAQEQTASLSKIDDYKTELLASLPIPGIEVVNGEVLRGGIPFDRLNTAQQVQIAVEVAKLRAGDLRVVCVDGIELLNSASYEAFRAQALDSGLQMFVSRVTDDEEMTLSISDSAQ